ncbi:MAG: GNAT family N-acetyltransferase, partial [Candidatus Woesearchaeota archaeon]
MTVHGLEVRPLTAAERPRLIDLLTREWGSSQIVSRGQIHDAATAPALGAFRDGRMAGLATYETREDQCEVLTLNAFTPRQGIGAALLRATARAAKSAGCRRLWLITTNDNLDAIRFYERQGLRLVAVHPGAVDQARKLKPSIPEFAPDGARIS